MRYHPIDIENSVMRCHKKIAEWWVMYSTQCQSKGETRKVYTVKERGFWICLFAYLTGYIFIHCTCQFIDAKLITPNCNTTHIHKLFFLVFVEYSFCKTCLKQAYINFPKMPNCFKILGTRKVPWSKFCTEGSTTIRCHHTKYSHPDNMLPRICAPLV